MRSVQVVTNETCELRCDFCNTRRPHERASVAAADAVVRRIKASSGSQEMILTGGEPTLRRDLPRMIRLAAEASSRVIMETNAWRIDAAMAHQLASAGLAAVRVHLPGHGEALDVITGGTGVWPRVVAAIHALRHEGVDIEVAVPIVAGNATQVASIPAAMRAADATPVRLWIRIPLRAPSATTLATPSEIADAVATLADTARSHDIDVALDPASYLAPCQLRQPARHAHLYRLNVGGADRSGYARSAGCRECSVVDRCAGLPTDAPRFVDAKPKPIADDRTRRRLTQIGSPQAQIERELVTKEIYRRPDGTSAAAHVIRINFRCNQACRFCFVSTHLPSASDDRVTDAIVGAASQGAIVVLSGGEPTLNPKLAQWVSLAKQHGAPEVELQSNAIRLADPEHALALADAGVDRAFVSLHAATEQTSDALTGAPGTFLQTLAGIDALTATAIAVRINYVLCRPNAAEFPAFVDLVAKRWPNAAITVSFVSMSTDLVPRTAALVPRYNEVLPALREGVRRAAAHGVDVEGFDSMCGIPLCLAPVPAARFRELPPPPSDYDGGEFVHPPPCQRCSLNKQCFGLRRGYAELYGWDELRPVAAP
ncbi:MAG: radical SAM protein [Nannocystaceae bacterium]|nr:radical SAM protein [Nannocystaceae bacterium]